MRFLVDMPLSPALARWLAAQDHDAVHATDLGMFEAEDTEIMFRARRESRIVVTADLDYPRLLAQAATVEPSIILFRGGNWSERGVIDRMSALLASLRAAEFERSIIVIERTRVRIRKLPLAGVD